MNEPTILDLLATIRVAIVQIENIMKHTNIISHAHSTTEDNSDIEDSDFASWDTDPGLWGE